MPVLFAVLVVVAAAVLLFTLAQPLRQRVLSLWQRSRGDSGVSRKLNNARLAQALAMGMASGLPLDEAVALSAGLMEAGAKERCLACQKQLEEGQSLSTALRTLLPANQCRLLELGQRSGTADSTMEKIAGDLAEESEAALENAVSRVEPALVLLCSLLVGLILLSVMLPLMHIMSAIG